MEQYGREKRAGRCAVRVLAVVRLVKAAAAWVADYTHNYLDHVYKMQRSDGFFRHHALFNRRLARHSGEDAGRAFHGGTLNSQDLPADIQEVIGSFTGRIPSAVRDRVLPEAFGRPSTAIRDIGFAAVDPQQWAPNRWAGLDPWARPGLSYQLRKSDWGEEEGIPDTSAKGPKKSRKRKHSGGKLRK